MTSRLLRLPGRGCRHFRVGRCLLEEHRNPGYDQGVRCEVLSRLVAAYDDLLGRLEVMDLSESQAMRVLSGRLEALEAQETCCHAGLRGATNLSQGCEHAWGDVCLLRLPPCRGQCPNYVLQRSKPRG